MLVGEEEVETSRVRVFDDSTFTELASAYLRPSEMGLSILSANFSPGGIGTNASFASPSGIGGAGRGGGGGGAVSGGGSGGGGPEEGDTGGGPCYLVVGTAVVKPEEPEPTEGRILVFELQV